MMTRRMFVGALAAVTAAGGSGLGAVLARRRRLPMAGVNARTVPPLKGQTVVLKSTEGSSLTAVVADVRSVRHRGDAHTPGTEQISLLLAADDPDALAGTYRIDGDQVSLGDLFLSPVGQAGRHRRLEAVITRIL
jgi:hypothetical protein